MSFFWSFADELAKIAERVALGTTRTAVTNTGMSLEEARRMKRLVLARIRPKEYEYHDASVRPSEFIEKVPSAMLGRGREDR